MKRTLNKNPETVLSILAALTLTACGKDIGSKFSYTEAPQPMAEIATPSTDTAATAKVEQTKMPLETVAPETKTPETTPPSTDTVAEAEDDIDSTVDVNSSTGSETNPNAAPSGETVKDNDAKGPSDSKKAEDAKIAEKAKVVKEAEEKITTVTTLANQSILAQVVSQGEITGLALKKEDVKKSISETIESLYKLNQTAEDTNVKKAVSINLFNLGVLNALAKSTELFDIGNNDNAAKNIDSALISEGNTKTLKDLEAEIIKQDSRSILLLNKGKNGTSLMSTFLDSSTIEATLTSRSKDFLKDYIKKSTVDADGKFKVEVSSLFENVLDLAKTANDAGISAELTSKLSSPLVENESVQFTKFVYILNIK